MNHTDNDNQNLTLINKKKDKTNIIQILLDKRIQEQIKLALPGNISIERFTRIAISEIRKFPQLEECTYDSFLGSLMQCAQLGLVPGVTLGHTWLVPYINKRKKQLEVQFILGYRGMLELARRSGKLKKLTARVVYENDTFSYRYGLAENLSHIPGTTNDTGQITYVYAIAHLTSNIVQFDVMRKSEIDKISNQSSRFLPTNSPWKLYYDEMAKKTVIRRLFKYLPLSVELQQAMILDERAEAGLEQYNSDILKDSNLSTILYDN